MSFMDCQVAPVWSPSHSAVEREAKRKPVFYTYMNLWPFLAVLLVLLVIFTVKDPLILHDIGPNLPSSFFRDSAAKGGSRGCNENIHHARRSNLLSQLHG